MAKINTDIIRKDYSITRNAVLSSYVLSTVYVDGEDIISSTFPRTLLINNKSNTFIRDVTLSCGLENVNETNVDILNVNQSKLNGKNVTILDDKSHTFIINTNNS